MAIKESMQKFSVRSGNSLLFDKHKLSVDHDYLFIGLGGMGCRTINALKKNVKDRIDDESQARLRFIAIDSCHSDLNNLKAVNGGYIDEEEIIELFDPFFDFSFEDPDLETKKWLNYTQMAGETLDDGGCSGRRQKGRVMLSNTNKYAEITAKIASCMNSSTRIILVSGISGGTGSGTIIDMGYLIRRQIDTILMANNHVDAYIYLPDVQERDQGIADTPKVNANNRNGYAALKEIDYFFNLSTYGGVYTYLSSMGGGGRSKENIFTSCCLISRYSSMGENFSNSAEAVEAVAKGIVFQLVSLPMAGNAGAPVPGPEAVTNNERSTVQEYYTYSDTMRPEWGMYRYRTMGCSSIYIPRDEMMTYCANLLFEKMVDSWEKSKHANEDTVVATLKRIGLDSLEHTVNTIYNLLDLERAISLDANDYPRKAMFGYNPTMEDAYEELKTKACLSTLYQRMFPENNSIINNFVDPILATVRTVFQDIQKGPYYAIALLSNNLVGNDPHRPDGLLKSIKNLKEEKNKLKTVYQKKVHQFSDERNGYFQKKPKNKEDIQDYVYTCEDELRSLAKMMIVEKVDEFLDSVFEVINKENNKLYKIYTSLLEELGEMLKSDSDYVANPKRTKAGTTESFSFSFANAIDPLSDDPTSKRFANFFSDYINTIDTSQACGAFVTNVFGQLYDKTHDPNHTGDWTERDYDDVVRYACDFFRAYLSDLCQDTVEKLCVIAYADSVLSPKDLNDIWSDPSKAAQKSSLQNQVARTIHQQLMRDGRPFLASPGGKAYIQRLSSNCRYHVTCLVNGMDDVNNAIQALLGTTSLSGIPSGTNWSEYTMLTVVYGIPFYAIRGLDNCQRDYSVDVKSPGLHMDEIQNEEAHPGNLIEEVAENWRTFPEPYGWVVNRMLGQPDKASLVCDYKILEEVKNDLLFSKKYGLLRKPNEFSPGETDVYRDVITGKEPYYYLNIEDFASITDSTKQKYQAALTDYVGAMIDNIDEESDINILGLLNNSGFVVDEYLPLKWTLFAGLDYFSDRLTIVNPDDSFGNLAIIVRGSMFLKNYLSKQVKGLEPFVEMFKETLAQIKESDRMFDEINSFCKALKYGLIYYSNEDDVWCFSTSQDGEAWLTDESGLSFTAADPIVKEFKLYKAFYNFIQLDKLFEGKKDAILAEIQVKVENNEPFVAERGVKIKEEISYVRKNEKFLAMRSLAAKVQIFKQLAKEDTFAVDYPERVANRRSDDGVKKIINNLEDFYREMEQSFSEF